MKLIDYNPGNPDWSPSTWRAETIARRKRMQGLSAEVAHLATLYANQYGEDDGTVPFLPVGQWRSRRAKPAIVESEMKSRHGGYKSAYVIYTALRLWRVKNRWPEISNDSRQAKMVSIRQRLCWLLAKKTRLSLPAIGREMGGRDHTTILHSIRKINSIKGADVRGCGVDHVRKPIVKDPKT